jgi:hypothetical protein
MQRRQGDEFLQRRQGVWIHQHRPGVFQAAVDYPVSYRDDVIALKRSFAAPGKQELDRTLVSQLGPGRPRFFADRPAIVVTGHEMRLRKETLQLAANE